jgi:hypothetical protein
VKKEGMGGVGSLGISVERWGAADEVVEMKIVEEEKEVGVVVAVVVAVPAQLVKVVAATVRAVVVVACVVASS